MRSQKECIELLRGYFQNKAKDYGPFWFSRAK